MKRLVSRGSSGRLWAFPTRYCTSRKYSNVAAIVVMLAALYLCLNLAYISILSATGVYWNWRLPKRDVNVKPFILSRTADVYMYSAFVHLPGETDQKTDLGTADIIITTLGKATAQMSCCVLSGDHVTLHMTTANIYFEHLRPGYKPNIYMARQFICRVPVLADSLRNSYITLSSKDCSTDIQDYLPILSPTRVQGGIALCGKIAHSGGLDPENVIEWFEVQRLLGVDKVLIFDLGNPETLNRVFRYYQNLGILDLQPYELPGEPKNRSLHETQKNTAQFTHDETMAVLECRQRPAGYDYIIGHDVDEFIIPRRDETLRDVIKKQLQREPNAAGFFFYTQFFMTTWKPTNPEQDLMVKRYRKSTEPLWVSYKYVYLPSRVKSAITHRLFPYNPPFDRSRVPPSDAVLHHYRRCNSDYWGNCSMKTIIDDSMTRYRDLEERVARVRAATSTKPQWS